MAPLESTSSVWFEREIRPHEPLLRAWLRKHFPQETDLDDVVQEAYLRILRVSETRPLEMPKAYLFAVARNLALDRAGKKNRQRRFETVLPGSMLAEIRDDSVESAGADRQRQAELIAEAIQSLPGRCREIFVLRKVYNLSQAEIAERLGLSRHTVSSQLSIGFQKCAAYVAARTPECEGHS